MTSQTEARVASGDWLAGASFSEEDLNLAGKPFLDLISDPKAENRHLTGDVPLELIDLEEVPIDQDNLDSLREQFKQHAKVNEGKGQIEPIILGHIPGSDKFYIIDGFHRCNLFQDNAKSMSAASGETVIPPPIKAVIIINSNMEEVRDLRIAHAIDHESVRMARAFRWIHESWLDTPWAEKVDVDQAFKWVNQRAEASRTTLSKKELASLNNWVEQKCHAWKLKPATIQRYLKIGSRLDMSLVEHYSGAPDGQRLSLEQLEDLGLFLENQPDLQWLIADLAVKKDLRGVPLRNISQQVSTYDIDKAQEIIHQFFSRTQHHSTSNGSSTRRRRSSPSSSPEATQMEIHPEALLKQEVEIGRLSLASLVISGFTPARLEGLGNRDNSELPPSIVDLIIGAGLKPSRRWGAADIPQARKFIANAVPKLIASWPETIKPVIASRLTERVTQRVIRDLEGGVVRFVPLGSYSQLGPTISRSIRDELAVLSSGKVDPNNAGTAPEYSSITDWQAPPYLAEIAADLPGLSPAERRETVLRQVFYLSNSVVAQVVGVSKK